MAGKAAISLTTGMEDTERVTVAFPVAVGAAEQGRPTWSAGTAKPEGPTATDQLLTLEEGRWRSSRCHPSRPATT